MPATWTEVGNIMGPPGPPGIGISSSDTDVVGEVPSGAVDGVNKNFVTALNVKTNSLAVFVNGLRQKQTLDYTVTGANTFQFNVAPALGDLVTVDYVVPPATTTPFYVGSKARFVALSNGVRLEVQDTGGAWQKQVEYTE